MNSIFLLTGAGAGPDIPTSYLTEQLLQWRDSLEPRRNIVRSIRRHMRKPESLNMWLRALESRLDDDASKRPFFRWLLDVSDEVYPKDAAEGFGYRPKIIAPNFEELIHIVERLSYMIKEPYYDSPYKRPPPYESAFFELSLLGRLLREERRLSMYDVVIRSSNFILDRVAEKAAENPNVEAQSVVTAIRKNSVTKVFSLNYDSRVVDISQEWWTGFRVLDEAEARGRDAKGGIQVFETQPEIPAAENAFIQLHGSTHFGWIASYVAPQYVIARHAKPLATHSTPRRGGFDLWNDRTALPALGIVTGFRKGEKVLTEPYASYFHYFRQEAYRTPNWLIIGYGGTDPHINAALRGASDYWGDRLRAYICNWISPEILGNNDAYRDAIKQRIGFLGEAGHRWASAGRTSSLDGDLVEGDRIRLTTDGKLAKHLDGISRFLDVRD